VVWADSRLNDEGVKQVQELGQFWANLVTEAQAPLPGTVYTSPLTRTLETTKYVFEPVFKQNGVPFQPIVKELLRERLTDHTCDRRSNRSWIAEHFPEYFIESGLTEEDKLWSSKRWETDDAHVARKQTFLEDIFTNDGNHFVALSTHSYAISAILTVLGLRHFRVREGCSIAVFVKGERLAV
jgi:broad specificity phosphatase PhoE